MSGARRIARPTTMCGGESLSGFDIGVVLGAEFLQDEKEAHRHKGVR
jgi:hypothetical protein